MASGSFGNGSGQNCALRISWSSSAGTGGCHSCGSKPK